MEGSPGGAGCVGHGLGPPLGIAWGRVGIAGRTGTAASFVVTAWAAWAVAAEAAATPAVTAEAAATPAVTAEAATVAPPEAAAVAPRAATLPVAPVVAIALAHLH